MKALTISYVKPDEVLGLMDLYSAENVTHLHLVRLPSGKGDESDESLFTEFRQLQRAATELKLKLTIELSHKKRPPKRIIA